jgi:hypothetical protein
MYSEYISNEPILQVTPLIKEIESILKKILKMMERKMKYH